MILIICFCFFYQKKTRMDRAMRLCGPQETRAPHEAVHLFKILLTMWYQWLFTLCLSCYCSYLLVQKNTDVWVSCLSWKPQVLEWKEMKEISERRAADHCNRSNPQTTWTWSWKLTILLQKPRQPCEQRNLYICNCFVFLVFRFFSLCF